MTPEYWITGFFILLALLLGAAGLVVVMIRRARYGLSERDSFLRFTSDLVIILDESLVVREVNRAARIKLGMSAGEGIGRNIEDTPFWPDLPADRRRAMKGLRRALNGERTLFSASMDVVDGHRLDFEIRAFPMVSPSTGKPGLICYGKDITVEFGTRQRLRRRTEVEDLIAGMMEAAFSGGDSRNHIPGILEMAGEFLGARRAFLLQTDRAGKVIWEFFWSIPGTPVLVNSWTGMNIDTMMPFNLMPGETILRDLPEHPEIPDGRRNQVREVGVRSLIIMPLAQRAGNISGYVGFTFNETQPPEDGSARILLKTLTTAMTGLLSRVDDQRDIKLFRESVDAAGQGIALISNEGTVIYSNATYGTLTGHIPESDRPVWEHYVGSFAEKVRGLILPMVASGQRWTGELRIQNRDGQVVDTIESFVPVDINPEDPRFIINMITDISDRKRLESQLINARKEAEIANRAKSDYLANMSHEIRTPMNAVIGLAYLALQTELDARQRDYISKINTAAKGLLNIINDILDLSKIEAGRLELETAPFSLDEVLESAMDIASQTAREKGLKLLYRRPPELPDSWEGDRFRLGQVLLNLVSNAVKFTNEGRVVVSVKADVPGYLRFSVEDTGIGMTEDQVSRLFRPFQQAAASTSREFGGTGLGLTISKQIVELMNGVITVTSTPGKGSRFEFTVALKRDGNHRRYPGGTKDGNPRAFVLCGDPQTIEFHANALRGIGYDVRVFESVKEVMEEPEYPDILMLDVDECSKDPASVAYALTDGAGEDFTLILSGSLTESELEKLAPRGIRALALPVPYSRSRLKDGLKEIGSGSGGSDVTKGFGATVVGGRILLADDNDINRQVGSEFLSSVGLEVDLAEDGQKALELYESNDYNLVFMDLHMPTMDGYEATRRLRGRGIETPVIAMTASTLHDVKSEILDAGFTGYIPKPIDPDHMFRVLSDNLGIPESLFRRTNREAVRPAEESGLPPAIDEDHAMRQVLGDRSRLDRLLQAFADKHETDAQQIAAGLRDSEDPVSLLHNLRGSAGQVGALSIMGAAGKLEEELRKDRIPEAAKFAALSRDLEALISDIRSGDAGPGIRVGLLDRLEELIRGSDDTAASWLEEEIATRSGPSASGYVERIRKALGRWNYDEALNAVDDWRVHGAEGII